MLKLSGEPGHSVCLGEMEEWPELLEDEDDNCLSEWDESSIETKGEISLDSQAQVQGYNSLSLLTKNEEECKSDPENLQNDITAALYLPSETPSHERIPEGGEVCSKLTSDGVSNEFAVGFPVTSQENAKPNRSLTLKERLQIQKDKSGESDEQKPSLVRRRSSCLIIPEGMSEVETKSRSDLLLPEEVVDAYSATTSFRGDSLSSNSESLGGQKHDDKASVVAAETTICQNIEIGSKGKHPSVTISRIKSEVSDLAENETHLNTFDPNSSNTQMVIVTPLISSTISTEITHKSDPASLTSGAILNSTNSAQVKSGSNSSKKKKPNLTLTPTNSKRLHDKIKQTQVPELSDLLQNSVSKCKSKTANQELSSVPIVSPLSGALQIHQQEPTSKKNLRGLLLKADKKKVAQLLESFEQGQSGVSKEQTQGEVQVDSIAPRQSSVQAATETYSSPKKKLGGLLLKADKKKVAQLLESFEEGQCGVSETQTESEVKVNSIDPHQGSAQVVIEMASSPKKKLGGLLLKADKKKVAQLLESFEEGPSGVSKEQTKGEVQVDSIAPPQTCAQVTKKTSSSSTRKLGGLLLKADKKKVAHLLESFEEGQCGVSEKQTESEVKVNSIHPHQSSAQVATEMVSSPKKKLGGLLLKADKKKVAQLLESFEEGPSGVSEEQTKGEVQVDSIAPPQTCAQVTKKTSSSSKTKLCGLLLKADKEKVAQLLESFEEGQCGVSENQTKGEVKVNSINPHQSSAQVATEMASSPKKKLGGLLLKADKKKVAQLLESFEEGPSGVSEEQTKGEVQMDSIAPPQTCAQVTKKTSSSSTRKLGGLLLKAGKEKVAQLLESFEEGQCGVGEKQTESEVKVHSIDPHQSSAQVATEMVSSPKKKLGGLLLKADKKKVAQLLESFEEGPSGVSEERIKGEVQVDSIAPRQSSVQAATETYSSPKKKLGGLLLKADKKKVAQLLESFEEGQCGVGENQTESEVKVHSIDPHQSSAQVATEMVSSPKKKLGGLLLKAHKKKVAQLLESFEEGPSGASEEQTKGEVQMDSIAPPQTCAQVTKKTSSSSTRKLGGLLLKAGKEKVAQLLKSFEEGQCGVGEKQLESEVKVHSIDPHQSSAQVATEMVSSPKKKLGGLLLKADKKKVAQLLESFEEGPSGVSEERIKGEVQVDSIAPPQTCAQVTKKTSSSSKTKLCGLLLKADKEKVAQLLESFEEGQCGVSEKQTKGEVKVNSIDPHQSSAQVATEMASSPKKKLGGLLLKADKKKVAQLLESFEEGPSGVSEEQTKGEVQVDSIAPPQTCAQVTKKTSSSSTRKLGGLLLKADKKKVAHLLESFEEGQCGVGEKQTESEVKVNSIDPHQSSAQVVIEMASSPKKKFGGLLLKADKEKVAQLLDSYEKGREGKTSDAGMMGTIKENSQTEAAVEGGLGALLALNPFKHCEKEADEKVANHVTMTGSVSASSESLNSAISLSLSCDSEFSDGTSICSSGSDSELERESESESNSSCSVKSESKRCDKMKDETVGNVLAEDWKEWAGSSSGQGGPEEREASKAIISIKADAGTEGMTDVNCGNDDNIEGSYERKYNISEKE